jgi:hypothetical protein
MVKNKEYKSGYQLIKEEISFLRIENATLEYRIRVLVLDPDSLEAGTIRSYYKSIEELSKIKPA